MVNVAIIGTGDLAYGLAHLFNISNCKFYGNFLEVTKPSLMKEGPFHDTGVLLTDFDDALIRADILILAIPSYGLINFVSRHRHKLKNKILVDPTNSFSRPCSEDLNSILAESDIRWVKAFNDIGAVDLLLKNPISHKKILTKMCSPSEEALKVVKEFAECSLGCIVKIVPYEQYNEVAKHQSSLGDDWIHATWTIVWIFILSMIYNIIRHPIKKGYPWRQFPLFVMNKSICWTALWGFAVAQIPGMIARVYNAHYQDTLRSKPKWLLDFLSMRKHLGLISLWLLSVHLLMSCLMFGIGYYDRFYYDKKDPFSRMSANGESSFMFGAFSAGLYFILGVSSLPSVAEQMTHAQWNLVYGPVAWVALAFGTIHVMCQGIGVTWQKAPWYSAGKMPPITLVSTVFPLFVIGLKFLQMIYVRTYGAKKDWQDKKHEDVPESIEEPLPHGWLELKDPSSGKRYFYDAVNNAVALEKPSLSSSSTTESIEPALTKELSDHEVSSDDSLPVGWEKHTDSTTGKDYYFHKDSNTTSWKKPVAQGKMPEV